MLRLGGFTIVLSCLFSGANAFTLKLRNPTGGLKTASNAKHVAIHHPLIISHRKTMIMSLHDQLIPRLEAVGRSLNTGVFLPRVSKLAAAVTLILSFVLLKVRGILWKPSRAYDRDMNTVGREYDAWCSEGILEAYWGEHIHLGYYNDEERARGYKRKDFVKAKYDFIDEMMKFGKVNSVAPGNSRVLDVGCGIGGIRKLDAPFPFRFHLICTCNLIFFVHFRNITLFSSPSGGWILCDWYNALA
jgi:hypothetical protein